MVIKVRISEMVRRRVIACALGIAAVWGCSSPDRIRVHLLARPVAGTDMRRVEITAQVAGPQAGLRYKWFSVSGECDPQQTESPSTVFRFAESAIRDRVTVEVWRGDDRVATADVNVSLDERRIHLAGAPAANVRVMITTVPPYNPVGGSETHAQIAGRVTGEIAADYAVVLYARADAWYIQPELFASLPIDKDGVWTSWTHTGSSYAALVVRRGFEALPRLDVLPEVGGYVVARTIVVGVRH